MDFGKKANQKDREIKTLATPKAFDERFSISVTFLRAEIL